MKNWFKTVGILGKTFKTKAACKDAIRQIIDSVQVGDTFVGESALFLLDVLRYHPEWEEKSGPGVEAIRVRMNTGTGFFRNKGLWLVRTDGSEIDISWVVAVDAQHTHHKDLVQGAARSAIASQIGEVRALHYGKPCSICQEPLVGAVHVDHKHPLTFDNILTNWLDTVGDVQVKDAGLHAVFADDEQMRDWQEYHRMFSELRLIHRHENLSLGNRAA